MTMTEEEFDELVEQVERLTDEELIASLSAFAEQVRVIVGMMDLIQYEMSRREYEQYGGGEAQVHGV